jgi:hypothetical protein
MFGKIALVTILTLLPGALIIQGGCVTARRGDDAHAFQYDDTAFPGPKPWTSDDFRNDPDDFQFAVVGDRTGGSDPGGIFDRAMHQLNLLQPEFVICVGDLVEGYTEDKARADAMWDEVEPVIEVLEMPFFYVPGNHDLGNSTMEEAWLARRGATYYHFVYKDVLFLALNSEDPSNPLPEDVEETTIAFKRLQQEDPAAAQAMLKEFMDSLDDYRVPFVMSEEQIEYVRKVLAANRSVRWTFVFFHQPDWEHETPGEAFLAIEEMLQDRPYTVIAGHLHYYDIARRHERDYITQGPVGASWHKNGPGNVDHILWITMQEDGPEIAQITLDGVWDRQGRDLELKEQYERTAQTEGIYAEP